MKKILLIAAMLVLVSVLAYAENPAVPRGLGGSIQVPAVGGTITMDQYTVTGASNANTQCRISMQGNKFITQYTDAGATQQSNLTPSGTGLTLVHSTIAP